LTVRVDSHGDDHETERLSGRTMESRQHSTVQSLALPSATSGRAASCGTKSRTTRWSKRKKDDIIGSIGPRLPLIFAHFLLFATPTILVSCAIRLDAAGFAGGFFHGITPGWFWIGSGESLGRVSPLSQFAVQRLGPEIPPPGRSASLAVGCTYRVEPERLCASLLHATA